MNIKIETLRLQQKKGSVQNLILITIRKDGDDDFYYFSGYPNQVLWTSPQLVSLFFFFSVSVHKVRGSRKVEQTKAC